MSMILLNSFYRLYVRLADHLSNPKPAVSQESAWPYRCSLPQLRAARTSTRRNGASGSASASQHRPVRDGRVGYRSTWFAAAGENYNIGIGHTSAFPGEGPRSVTKLTFGYTCRERRSGTHGFLHTNFGEHTERPRHQREEPLDSRGHWSGRGTRGSRSQDHQLHGLRARSGIGRTAVFRSGPSRTAVFIVPSGSRRVIARWLPCPGIRRRASAMPTVLVTRVPGRIALSPAARERYTRPNCTSGNEGWQALPSPCAPVLLQTQGGPELPAKRFPCGCQNFGAEASILTAWEQTCRGGHASNGSHPRVSGLPLKRAADPPTGTLLC